MIKPTRSVRDRLQCRLEILIVPITALLFFAFLYGHVGGPLTWDELLYMDLSWNLDRQDWICRKPWLINRYSHIYLQALFMWLAGSPLLGVRLYWSFLVTVSLVGTYILARMLARRASWLVGVAAIFLFLSIRLAFRFSGVTYAEFTLMALLPWLAIIFLAIQKSDTEPRRRLLTTFGFLFLLALKTKEMAAATAVLLVGFGSYSYTGFSVRTLRQSLIPLIMGFLVGCFFFVVLDCVFVFKGVAWLLSGDVSALPQLGQSYARPGVKVSTVSFLTAGTMLFPTCLYLASLSGLKLEAYRHREEFVWTIPIAFLLTLVFRSYVLQRESDERFLIPLLPILCACAAQVFQFLTSQDANYSSIVRVLLFPALIPISIAFAFDWFGGYERVAARAGWDIFDFHAMVTYPAGTLVCLGMLALARMWTPIWLLVFGSTVWLTLYPALQNNHESLTGRVAAQNSERRFQPLISFRDAINPSQKGGYFVSKSIDGDLGMFGRDTATCSLMFNAYFGAKTTYEDFRFDNVTFLFGGTTTFERIFLLKRELAVLEEEWDREDNVIHGNTETSYSIITDEKNGLALLVLAPS